MEYTGLAIAGPEVARPAAGARVATICRPRAFPFMSFRQMDVGILPALVGRVSFTGDLGYEIWVKAEYQRSALRPADGGRRAATASGSSAAGR